MKCREISAEVGVGAIRSCLAVADRPVSEWKTAVRWGLQELARLAPGRSVEVRVPGAGAVQIMHGTQHRRGTPPAVVEMNMQTFVALAGGLVTWTQIVEASYPQLAPVTSPLGAELWIEVSGERTNLGHLFPLI